RGSDGGGVGLRGCRGGAIQRWWGGGRPLGERAGRGEGQPSGHCRCEQHCENDGDRTAAHATSLLAPRAATGTRAWLLSLEDDDTAVVCLRTGGWRGRQA